MSRTFTVIVSPAAGRGRALRYLPRVEAALRGSGRAYHAVTTRSLEHGQEVADLAVSRGDDVIVIGGDGLVHFVIQAVAGSASTLAVVPGGTCNDFASALGIDSIDVAIDAITSGKTRRIDLGKVGQRFFSCIASIGLDSDVIEAANRVRVIHGPLVYPYATIKALTRWKPATFTIDLDGNVSEIRGYNVAVANAGNYGGGMKLVPGARMDDGKLSVLWVSEMPRVRFLAQARKVFSGAHVHVPGVSVAEAERVQLTVDRPFTVYADGEAVGSSPMDVRVVPGALDVTVPAS